MVSDKKDVSLLSNMLKRHREADSDKSHLEVRMEAFPSQSLERYFYSSSSQEFLFSNPGLEATTSFIHSSSMWDYFDIFSALYAVPVFLK